MNRLVLALIAVASTMYLPTRASAGGFTLGDRGVRAMGRGGAFVAGADDADALWYNPAGLSYAGSQLFADAMVNFFQGSFTRIDSVGNVQPTVDAAAPIVPVPMIAYTDNFHARDWNFGFGLFAPNGVILTYPESITVNGIEQPAPQRYSLISAEGSGLVHVGAAASWRPIPQLSVGLMLQVIGGNYVSRVVAGGCDGVACSFPEDPEFDATSEFRLFVASPSAILGAILDLDGVRVGVSAQLPYAISGEGKLRQRLPSASLFDGARIEGNRAAIDVDVPLFLRAGVEVRPQDNLRFEIAAAFENWSIQEEIVTRPKNVWIRDVNGLGDYQVGPITIPRNMNDVLSVRLGGEMELGAQRNIAVRAGFMYESGAFDDSYMSPLTMDSDKAVVSVGGSYEVSEGVWLDAVLAHYFMRNREVTASLVTQPNPIRPPRTPDRPANEGGAVYIGDGTYELENTMVGVGIRWSLDRDDDSRE